MIVQITSKERKLTHRLKFQNTDTELKPGQSMMVNWEQACFWLGDPGTLDARRRDEYDRKRTWWGFALGFDKETEEEASASGTPGASWETKRPKLEVYAQDGQRLYMVLDDPDGTKSNPAISAPAPMADQLAALQAQVAQLTALLTAKAPSTETAGDGTVAGADTAADVVPQAPADSSGAGVDRPKTGKAS